MSWPRQDTGQQSWPRDDDVQWPPAQATTTPTDSDPGSAHPTTAPPTPRPPSPSTPVTDLSGYESPDDDFDLDRDDAENERLRAIRCAQVPHRYHGLNAKSWFCDSCRRRIDTYDAHYHCFDCDDYDLCHQCYHSKKGFHLHKGENWFYELRQPNWFTVGWIMEDDDRSSVGVLRQCFEDYAVRRFVGTRLTPDAERYTWLTYQEVYDMSKQVSKALLSPQIGMTRKTNQFVAILSSIRLEVPSLWFGSNFATIPFVPIQQILSMGEKTHIVKQCLPKIIFCEKKHIAEVLQLRAAVPGVMQFAVLLDNDADAIRALPQDTAPGFMTFEDFLAIGKADTSVFDPPKLAPEDLAMVIYTSGTTGVPKGIVFRENAWMIELTRANSTLPLVLYGFLPFSHISGMSDVLLPFFNGGHCGLLCESDLKNLFDDFRILRPTILSTIPRLLNFVYNEFHRRAKREPKGQVFKDMIHVFGDRIIEICVGSAYCSNKVKRFIRRLCRVPLYDGYGVSEVGTVAFDYKVADGVQTRLLDCPELGYLSTDKPHPRGELLVKNKLTNELEYYQSQEITKNRFDPDGFFHTGDIVEMRGDRIVIIDRRNNILKLAQGEFVSLEKVEAALETSPMIDQMVAFANPSKTKLVAIVVVFEEEVTSEDVLADMRRTGDVNQLNSWEIPTFLHLTLEKLPLTELKKKSRRRIKAKFKDELNALYRESQKKEGDKFEVFLADLLEVQTLSKELSWKQMGGTSFKSVPLLDELEALGFQVPFAQLETMTIAEILDIVRGATEETMQTDQYDREAIVTLDEDNAKMGELVARLKQLHRPPAQKKTVPDVIFLTGASGFLGGFVLTQLRLTFPRSRIVCLVRERSAQRLLSVTNAKLQVVVGDLASPNFGMSQAEFDQLQKDVDLVVHCGAMVNHFVTFRDHYDANVRSAYDIVRLSCGWKPIVYVSTISVYEKDVPKPSVEMEQHKHGNGYPASKWVADCLLSRHCKSHVSVVRPSLIGGSPNYGTSNLKDWLNRVLHGMVVTGCVPTHNSNGQVPFDMASVDDVAACVIALAKLMGGGQAAVNVAFPNVCLDEIVDFVAKYYEEERDGEPIRKAPFPEWLGVVQQRKKHPMSPFVGKLRPTDFFGMNRFVAVDMSRFDEVMGAGYLKKVNYQGMKKILDYLMENMQQ